MVKNMNSFNNSFGDKVIAEARLHARLKKEGRPISWKDRKYACLSGLILTLICALGLGVLHLVFSWSKEAVFGGDLWCVFFLIGGLWQLVFGVHLLTTREFELGSGKFTVKNFLQIPSFILVLVLAVLISFLMAILSS